MPTRVHAAFDPLVLNRIDREVAEKGISRTQWMSETVSAWMTLLDRLNGADPTLELDRLRTSNDSLWRENKDLKRDVEKATSDVPLLRTKLKECEDQLAAMTSELETLRSDVVQRDLTVAHYKETLDLKSQEISFLQGHIAQLTQSISQLALPPSQEEAKKRGWWRFWK